MHIFKINNIAAGLDAATALLKDQLSNTVVDTLLKRPSNAPPRGIHHSEFVCMYVRVIQIFNAMNGEWGVSTWECVCL